MCNIKKFYIILLKSSRNFLFLILIVFNLKKPKRIGFKNGRNQLYSNLVYLTKTTIIIYNFQDVIKIINLYLREPHETLEASTLKFTQKYDILFLENCKHLDNFMNYSWDKYYFNIKRAQIVFEAISLCNILIV